MGKLNVNFLKSITKFESIMKKQFLIKSIFYKKLLRGKSLDLDYHRKYTAGDDFSLIDWKVSKRTNELVVRKYVEERDLKIFFIVDVGDNMVLGSGEYLKNEIAAEIAACIAHLAIILGDSVGFELYGENIKIRRMFSSGIEQFYIFEKNLRDSKIYGGKSDLAKVLETLMPNLKNASAIFIISDFVRFDEKCSKILSELASKYETIGIMVRDPVDVELPNLKREVVIEDVHTGRQILINPGLIRHEYRKHAFKQKKEIKALFKKNRADLLTLYTNKDFVMPLAQFLKLRVKSKGAFLLENQR